MKKELKFKQMGRFLMYKKTKAKNIEAFLKEHPRRYYTELEELDELVFDDEAKFYESKDMFIMTTPSSSEQHIWAIPKTKDFDLANFEKWLSRQANDFRIEMNVTGINSGEFRFQEFYDVSLPHASYWSKAETDLENKAEYDSSALATDLKGSVRQLKESDAKAVKEFPQTETRGVLGLDTTFAFVINDEIGSITAYFDESDKLCAYLSNMPGMNGVYIVDDIYVLPSYREKGIATSLLLALEADAKANNTEIYWPIAETELAQKTAEAAGFEKVAERITIKNL